MQPYTRELYEKFEEIPDKIKKNFLRVPEELHEAVGEVLDGKYKTIVTEKTPAGKNILAWARNQRKKQRKKGKKKRKKG